MDRLNRKVFGTLFFSIFATVTGVGIVLPLLPVYAHQSGASGFAIGLIIGSFSVSRTLFAPFFGRLSDRAGRKPLIVPGLLAYAATSLLFIAYSGVTGLIVIRFLQGIASAVLMPVIQAYVGDITPGGREGATMGLFNLSMFFGLSLGPLLGGAIQDRWGMTASFAAMGLLAFIGFLLALALLPPARAERIVQAAKPPGPWKRLIVERGILSLFIFRFAYTFAIGILWSFLPVLAVTEHALSATAAGTVLMLGIFISGGIQVPLGLLADRVARRGMIAAGGVVIGLAMFAFEMAPGYAALTAASILFGIGGGIAMAAHMALSVQKGGETDSMGSVMAILTVAHSGGLAAGAVAGGLTADFFSLRAVFPMGAAVLLGGTALFWAASPGGRSRKDLRPKVDMPERRSNN